MNPDSANAEGGSMDGTVAPGRYTHGKLVDDRGGGEDAPNGKISKFLALLHEVISDPDTNTCIHWLPCGPRFMISDEKKFAKDILPRFSKGKLVTFISRLRQCGFNWVTSKDVCVFHNPQNAKTNCWLFGVDRSVGCG